MKNLNLTLDPLIASYIKSKQKVANRKLSNIEAVTMLLCNFVIENSTVCFNFATRIHDSIPDIHLNILNITLIISS